MPTALTSNQPCIDGHLVCSKRLFLHLPEMRVAARKSCRHAVFPNKSTHLGEKHRSLPVRDRQDIAQQIRSWPDLCLSNNASFTLQASWCTETASVAGGKRGRLNPARQSSVRQRRADTDKPVHCQHLFRTCTNVRFFAAEIAFASNPQCPI